MVTFHEVVLPLAWLSTRVHVRLPLVVVPVVPTVTLLTVTGAAVVKLLMLKVEVEKGLAVPEPILVMCGALTDAPPEVPRDSVALCRSVSAVIVTLRLADNAETGCVLRLSEDTLMAELVVSNGVAESALPPVQVLLVPLPLAVQATQSGLLPPVVHV